MPLDQPGKVQRLARETRDPQVLRLKQGEKADKQVNPGGEGRKCLDAVKRGRG
jgi:hypothetical protein